MNRAKIKAALERAIRWAQGDKWREGALIERKAWVEHMSELNAAVAELSESEPDVPLVQIAQLIVEKYKDMPDDYPISLGHWQTDGVLGAPHKEFCAFLRVDLRDWRQYAKNAREAR